MKQRRDKRFSHIPYTLGNCVYLAEMSDGVIKVGFSNNPRMRLQKLAQGLRSTGHCITQYALFPGGQHDYRYRFDPQQNELRAINALTEAAEPITGYREYFTGISFDIARNVIAPVLKP